MKYRILTLTLFALLVSAQGLLHAYPSALNVVPTASILPAGTIQLGYESDGHSQPFADGRVQYLYSQIGIRDRLEVGVDLYDIGGAKEPAFNAKVLLLPEAIGTPALALGVMNVTKGTTPGTYLVGTKNIGRWGIHAGIEHQADQTWGLLGANFAVNQKISLLGDYQSGDGRQGTVGVYYAVTPALGVNVYYAKNNTDSSADYLGLYVGYAFSAKK